MATPWLMLGWVGGNPFGAFGRHCCVVDLRKLPPNQGLLGRFGRRRQLTRSVSSSTIPRAIPYWLQGHRPDLPPGELITVRRRGGGAGIHDRGGGVALVISRRASNAGGSE